MTKVQAYAATKPKDLLKPFEYELGALGPSDVDISVKHCGICHSDLSMLDDEWGISQYPLVPGHEVIGTISSVGEQVSHLKKGDLVGLGWHSSYCLHCLNCLSGDHNMCSQASPTIVHRHGGFADTVRAQATSVIKLPDGITASEAGPLFCGGVTVFNPLIQYNISPTANVAVIGIGGLGHLALKFMRAWGCQVTAFTSSESKQQEALELGAHTTINSKNPEAISKAASSFDLILSTVNVNLDWDAYISTLKSKGKLHFVGAVLEPLNFSLMPILSNQNSISASPVASPATISKMLEFAARHHIQPTTEHFPLAQVNEAMDRLRNGKAHYRIILDM